MMALVLAAHPDDETLGVGGTIARLVAAGADVHVHILADGVMGRHPGSTADSGMSSARAATSLLGATCSFSEFGHGGQLLSDLPQRDIVAVIDELLLRYQPNLVFTHHTADIHVDHRVISLATRYAAKSFGHRKLHDVLHYEVLSSTEQQLGREAVFVPSLFYDIESFLAIKMRAFREYPTEYQAFPHPRSPEGIETLARFRGLQCAREAAEAFMTYRIVR